MQVVSTEALDFSKIVRPGDRVAWGQTSAEPRVLTAALMAQRVHIGRFSAFIGITWDDVLQAEHGDHVEFVSYCGGGRNRELARSGALDIWPGHYSELATELGSGTLRTDVLLLQVAPMGADGRHSLSMACEYLSEAIALARCIVVEINDQAPDTPGPLRLSPEQITWAVHTSRSIVDSPPAKGGEIDDAVARRVAGLIEDGSTLQCGIGSLPEAVLRRLRSHRDLGLHSGAMGDGVVELAQAGVLNNARKTIDRGVSVAGVLMGTRVVRDYAHRNPAVALHPSSYTHQLDVLSRLERFVAINAAIEVDLTGQINAEIAGRRYLGAVGGAVDFLRGAHASRGGLPIIALPARTPPRGAQPGMPRIVAQLQGPASTARSDAGIVVTENGVADLRGLPLKQRIRRMLEVAHPDDREALAAHAHAALGF